MTEQSENGGMLYKSESKDGSVTSNLTATTQTRFSFYNAQDYVQEAPSTDTLTVAPSHPPLKKNTGAPAAQEQQPSTSRDSVEILRSLQEHELQRQKILGASVGSSASAVSGLSNKAASEPGGKQNGSVSKETAYRMDVSGSAALSDASANPYEVAIKEALDLLRKHRAPKDAGSQASTSASVRATSPVGSSTKQSQQWIDDLMAAAGSRTPPEADCVLQSRTAGEGAPFFAETNKQDASADYEDGQGTPSALALGEAYQVEIEARRKQRQERMLRYATRLAELKQEDKYTPPSSENGGSIAGAGDGGQAWGRRSADASSWTASTETPLNSRSAPNDFPVQDNSPIPMAEGTAYDSLLSQAKISKEEEVQRGVERVLLAILERASSQGRGVRDQSETLRELSEFAGSSSWLASMRGEEKKAIDPMRSRTSADSLDNEENALVRAMTDLLGAPSTSTLGSSSPNGHPRDIVESQQQQNLPKGVDKINISPPNNESSNTAQSQLSSSEPKSSRKVNLTVDTRVAPEEDDIDKIVRTVLVQDTSESKPKTDDSIDRRVRSVLSPDVEKQRSNEENPVGDQEDGGDDYVGKDDVSTESTHNDDENNDAGEEGEEEGPSSFDRDLEDGDHDDNPNNYSDLDGVLGPLSKTAGGTTGVVLEAYSTESKDSMPSLSLLDSISAAVSLVTGNLATEPSFTFPDVDDETRELTLSLCAHLIPRRLSESLRVSEKRPEWDESNPDEAGYRIIRLTSGQLSSVEFAFDRIMSEYKKRFAARDTDEAFENDLKTAEAVLDSRDKRAIGSELSGTSDFPQHRPLEGFPGIKSTGRGEMGDLEYFHLPIIFKSHVTGFEPTKDLVLESGNVVAGQYLVEGELGSAAFSTAYRCVDLNSDGDGPDGHDEVCLKVIKNTKDFFDQSLDEIKILELLRQTGRCHEKHLVEMRTFFYHREHLIIVTELLRQNLFEFGKFIIDSEEEPYFTMPRLSYLTRQILEALDFVHRLGLVHSDIKPENILLSSYSRAQVKVIDFGSSCFLTDRQSSYIQSRSYRAPEVILGLPYDGRIDVWSLGCVVAEMFTGEVTFQNDSIVSMLSRIEAICGTFPSHMIANGRQSGRFFTKSGLLYEKLPGNEDDSSSHSNEDDDDSESSPTDKKKRYVDLFQPKVTTLSERLGFSPDLMKKFDEGRKMSRDEKRKACFVDFVRKLLTIDPEKRPTAAQALNHPWMIYAEGLIEEEIKYPSC